MESGEDEREAQVEGTGGDGGGSGGIEISNAHEFGDGLALLRAGAALRGTATTWAWREPPLLFARHCHASPAPFECPSLDGCIHVCLDGCEVHACLEIREASAPRAGSVPPSVRSPPLALAVDVVAMLEGPI